MTMGHAIEPIQEEDNVFQRVSNAMKVWQSKSVHVMTSEELKAFTESVWKQGYDAAMAEMGVDQDE